MNKKEKTKDDVFRFRCEEDWVRRLNECARIMGKKSSAWVHEVLTNAMLLVEAGYIAGRASTVKTPEGGPGAG